MRSDALTATSIYVMVCWGLEPCSCSTYILQEPGDCITSVWNSGTNTPHCMESYSKCHWL